MKRWTETPTSAWRRLSKYVLGGVTEDDQLTLLNHLIGVKVLALLGVMWGRPPPDCGQEPGLVNPPSGLTSDGVHLCRWGLGISCLVTCSCSS